MVKVRCQKCGKEGYSASSIIRCLCGGECHESEPCLSNRKNLIVGLDQQKSN